MSVPRSLFRSTYRRQEWSLPDSVIYYITKKPSSLKYYQKMIQSCQHFFIKNPILPIRYFSLHHRNNTIHVRMNIQPYERPVDLKNIASKIWIIHELMLCGTTEQNWIPSIFPKIHQIDLQELRICNQNIFFNDMILLGSKVKKVVFDNATVFYKNGNVVPLEKIVENLSYLEDIAYYLDDNASKIITSKTASNLLEILNLSKLTKFHVFDVPETFNIEIFYVYIKENMKANIWLEFCDEISEGFKARLQTIVDEIIDDEAPRKYMIPYINFPNITRSSDYKLWKLYFQRVQI